MHSLYSVDQRQSILDYWMQLELLAPFKLDTALPKGHFFQQIWSTAEDNDDLPWIGMPVLTEQKKTREYNLYLGLFSYKEAANDARAILANRLGQSPSIDWRHCASSANISCFAKLPVDEFGRPKWSRLALSTMPWALGCLLNQREPSLTLVQYARDTRRLLNQLRRRCQVALPTRSVDESEDQYGYMDFSSLCVLTNILFDWAGYKPQGHPIALIEELSGEALGANDFLANEEDPPILNSFYIDDLSSVTFPKRKGADSALDQYLSGGSNSRVALDSAEGLKALSLALQPSRLPAGRWPSPLSHRQSLMQQFAINQSFQTLQGGGVFSVNGPPGTGKTTMLSEIVAENMVSRARALSRFSSSRAAFIGKTLLAFDNGKTLMVSKLHSSLLGYEMLAVSSNNAAVQNISHELPLRSQVDPRYAALSYLQSVAHKVYEADRWGLISAAIGSSKNCRLLLHRIFFKKGSSKKGQGIWDWIDTYAGPSFSKAKERFHHASAVHSVIVDELETLSSIHAQIHGLSEEGYCRESLEALARLKIKASEASKGLVHLEEQTVEKSTQIALLKERKAIWRHQRPAIWARLIGSKSWRAWASTAGEYNAELLNAVEGQLKLRELQAELKRTLKLVKAEMALREAEYLERILQFGRLEKQYKSLGKRHSNLRMPDSREELASCEGQKHAYYQSDQLSLARSDLFVASMALHEAWLAETLKHKGGFRANLLAISYLLQGACPTTDVDTLLAWQSTFLLIPVLSSTFASIGRLFRNLGPKSIGWVLIDEAGQATPQAAVGAIWRAQRVLSIGDPFQIEPISPVPSEIEDGISKAFFAEHFMKWAPSRSSVQLLMDEASTFGLERDIGEQSYWLGSPLRVHRRCQEPMFSIANELAYDGSMLMASEQPAAMTLRDSCWFDVKGEVSDRQYVPNQGIELAIHLAVLFQEMEIPDVYIISPFRAVVSQLKTELAGNSSLRALFKKRYSEIAWMRWIHQAIGTVHTFQGKQSTVVFLVLGGDESTQGATRWAAMKPNLLNVALTRARHRFYVIGDRDLWAGLPFFELAARSLARVESDEKSRACPTAGLLS